MSEDTNDPSTALAAPRPKFKQVKKKKKSRLREHKESDDDELDASAMQAIEATRKKRKLLNEVLYKKGVNAATLVQPPVEAVASVETTSSSQKDVTERLRNFAGGGGGATAEGGVLQRKHQSAMEEFIQENLKHKEQEKQQQEQEESTKQKTDTENLYAELATASQKLAGITSIAVTTGEADVGAGGAMLGGTGIAEVTLPADDRIQAIRATEEAVSSFPSRARKRSSAVPQDALHVLDDSSERDDTLNVPSSYSHNFQLHTQEWIEQKKREDEAMDTSRPLIQQDDSDGERMGFEAARRAARGQTVTNAPTQVTKARSPNDDRAWKNFMTRQQQSRDRY